MAIALVLVTIWIFEIVETRCVELPVLLKLRVKLCGVVDGDLVNFVVGVSLGSHLDLVKLKSCCQYLPIDLACSDHIVI